MSKNPIRIPNFDSAGVFWPDRLSSNLVSLSGKLEIHHFRPIEARVEKSLPKQAKTTAGHGNK